MKSCSWSTAIAFAILSASAAGCGLSDEGLGSGPQEDEASAALTNAFTITIFTETAPQNQVTVTSSDGTPLRSCVGSCEFAYLAGSALQLRVPFPQDRINCLLFGGWFGACSGQGTTCNLTLNSNLSTEVNWVPWRGCQPQ